MTFLIADGVVPSNEDRGYILRRVMRRAIQQGRRLNLEPGFLAKFAQRVIELMGAAYPEVVQERAAIVKWLDAEEQGFTRTLDNGVKLLDDLIAEAQAQQQSAVSAAEVFLLHDTYGFPFDLTRELFNGTGFKLDQTSFERLMDRQRARARASAGQVSDSQERDQIRQFTKAATFTTEFTGYHTLEQATTVGAVEAEDGRLVVKLTESPFYAQGGGQVSDTGTIECVQQSCRATVTEVFRVGEDQAVAVNLERGQLEPGTRVLARVDALSRHATEANHTATHLLHAALRQQLGEHVRGWLRCQARQAAL